MREKAKGIKWWNVLIILIAFTGYLIIFDLLVSEFKKPLAPIADTEITQLKKENASLKARNDELTKWRDQELNYFTNQMLSNEYIFIKNDSLISLMDSDTTIELLAINLSKKVRNKRGYISGDNDTTSSTNK
ncbi:MAG: hypothetical protein HGA42_00560 [Nostocales cyanobacterium W4_Combined_metabat2_030]|nr:hypothetical protein [Nostocales cyanobacterium W4_Combined_metabat2_030]